LAGAIAPLKPQQPRFQPTGTTTVTRLEKPATQPFVTYIDITSFQPPRLIRLGRIP
jgi:hypothetical protein